MTDRANVLTKRASVQASGWEGTAPASDLRVLIDVLTGQGHRAESLLAAAGLTRAELEDPDARVPCTAHGAILARAQADRPTRNLGLRLAQATPIGAYPVLDYLILTSSQVGAGMRQLARYFRLVGSPIALAAHEDDRGCRLVITPPGPDQFAVEYTVSLAILHFREETNGRFSAESVHLTHQPDDVPDFERTLACPVRGGGSWNGLAMTKGAWQLPLRRRDAVLRGVLERHANDILATLPMTNDLATDVRRVLAAQVAAGDVRASTVARRLGLSTRTLQRRLLAAGASYQALLDATRRDAAARHLSDRALATSEIAYLLGYSEPAPFHRAFKRWFGVTPAAFRQRAQSER